MSAEAFDRVRDRWGAGIGRERVAALETDLRAMAGPGQPLRLDLPGWLGS